MPRQEGEVRRRLESRYRTWLDQAVPLLREEELSSFLQMTEPQKDAFIREFWKRRSEIPEVMSDLIYRGPQ